MWADPIVVQHISGRAFTPEESWSRVVRYVGHWELLGFGYWGLRETATDRFVGEIGFADYHRDLVPTFDGAPEIGWALASWAHGKGFAKEGIEAVVKWGDTHLVSPRTVCLIEPGHAASIHLAERDGYRAFANTSYRQSQVSLFERLRAGAAPRS